MAILGVTREHTIAVISARWRKHGIEKTDEERAEWIRTVLEPRWAEGQAIVDSKNAIKAERKARREQTKLKARILKELESGPRSVDVLAKALESSSDAVQSHLARMVKKGRVVRVGFGVYVLNRGKGRSVLVIWAMRAIRKSQVRWIPNGDSVDQRRFVRDSLQCRCVDRARVTVFCTLPICSRTLSPVIRSILVLIRERVPVSAITISA